MGSLLRLGPCLLVCCCLIAPASYGRDAQTTTPKLNIQVHENVADYSPDYGELYILAVYSFDSGPTCVPEGWMSVDRTAQLADFWHVDDFAGLGGGTFGQLTPLEGSQSLWCGARPSASVPLCGYGCLPGYGNNWDQAFCTKNCLQPTGDVELFALLSYDTELGYDRLQLEYDQCDDNWITVETMSGISIGTPHLWVIADSLYTDNVRFRLHFTSDAAWSDEDCLHNTDGAVIIDSLSVRDQNGFVLAVEDFEGEAVGATVATDWWACTPVGYGDFAGLFSGATLVQEDPFHTNPTCTWGFFNGSTANYACGGSPGQLAVPYMNARNQYIHNDIWSPQIAITGTGNTYVLRFDVYRDLDLDGLVFYDWHVRSVVAGCPGQWKDYGQLYYGNAKGWHQHNESIGTLVEPGASHLQIALGVVDMTPMWTGRYGSGTCHSHAPLFDNVVVYRREDGLGPQIHVEEAHFFQDTFADPITGQGRSDIAMDIRPAGSPTIQPGDSMVVTVTDPDGLAGDAYTGFGPAVYLVVHVRWANPAGKSGADLTDDPFRWPVVHSAVVDSNTFYYVRMDTVFKGPGRTNPVPDRFCVDLNDNFFEPGDTIDPAVEAKNTWGKKTLQTLFRWGKWIIRKEIKWVGDGVEAGIEAYLQGNYVKYAFSIVKIQAGGLSILLKMTHAKDIFKLDRYKILKGAKSNKYVSDRASPVPDRILYVNDSGAHNLHFEWAFALLGIQDKVDQYRVHAPSSLLGNGPGSRFTDIPTGVYNVIIWDTGDTRYGTIGDGNFPEKSNDFAFLRDFIENNPVPGGVYICGDNVAEEWAGLAGAEAIAFRNYIQHNLVNPDHRSAGQPMHPLVIGKPGGCFDHVPGPDTLIAYGGVAIARDYDFIAPLDTATTEMTYSGTPAAGAVIAQRTTNAQGQPQGVVLSGFSFHRIYDDRSTGMLDRVEHLRDILAWLNGDPGPPVGLEPIGYANSLSQNYPNPFNPSTRIRYSFEEPGRTTLRVYNVAGQLVRTLVNEDKPAGMYSAEWDGRDHSGNPVASGVYFYKLVAPNYRNSKKMVILK
jgi:hypothetical protein